MEEMLFPGDQQEKYYTATSAIHYDIDCQELSQKAFSAIMRNQLSGLEEGDLLGTETYSNGPVIREIYEEIRDEAIIILSEKFMHFTAMIFSGTNIRNVKVYKSRSGSVPSFVPPSPNDVYRRKDGSHIRVAK